jgi:Tol biopolymer transport system component
MTRAHRTIAGWVLLILLGAMALAAAKPSLLDYIPGADRWYTRWVPPMVPGTTSADRSREEQALKELGRQVQGRLVWSSNRSGNHEIYLADLQTGQIRQLTHNSHVDYMPRFSPDGQRISFLRTRREWASFREGGASDLFLMQADGSGERRLAEHADHATWRPDGKGLVFVRIADNRIVSLDLGSSREVVLAAGDEPPIDGSINDPGLSDDGMLALTLRGVSRKRRGVGVWDGRQREYVPLSSSPSACQITWVPGTRRAVWIEGSSGRGGTRVMTCDAPGTPESVLIDLPGEYSHEYFPTVSRDGQWLTWGASTGGHEHDRADYEIFAWRLGSSWSSAMRLTFSPANDQWPELFPDG